MHTKHLQSSSQALWRVFVLPSLSQTSTRLTGSCGRKYIPRPVQQPPELRPPFRAFSATSHHQAKTRAPELRTEKWDEEIQSSLVYLVNPTTNEIETQPTRRDDVLRRIDRKTHRLVQVSDKVNIKLGNESNEGGQDEPAPEQQEPPAQEQTLYRPNFAQPTSSRQIIEEQIPVCKIVSKKQAHQQAEKRKLEAKERRKVSALTSSVKTLELNWAIDSNDLGHRLDRVQEFLSEGRKVEIVLAAKKRGRKASPDECQGVLQRIRSTVKGVDGAKEERPMEGKLGGFTTLAFAGRPPSSRVQKEAAS